MKKVSKEELYEELQDMIGLMNREDYLRDPDMFKTRVPRKKHGEKAAKAILKKFRKTTLYELNRLELQQALDLVHQIPIKGSIR